jgi:transcriptional regulator with PAS, ATPase and Fis domain
MPRSSPDPSPRTSWTSLLQQTTDAVFLLNPRRRLRYVNRAFEALTRSSADAVVHEYCHPRKTQKDLPASRRALLQTLAPPTEVMKGRIEHVRRPVPPAKLGPPWWDITFVPLREGDKLIGVLGVIVPVGSPGSTAGGKGLAESVIALRQAVVARVPLSLFDGESPALRRIHAQAELAAKILTPVWITGASGTGKETLARAIHFHGATRELAFATIDCAGLQPYLIRSLLFGHNGLAESGRIGTIYLKSAEELSAELQTELIEWGELLADECRLAIGTSSPNELGNDFRATFEVIAIHLPRLAERLGDLPRLVAAVGKDELAAGTSPEAMAALAAWSWPGNLRELRETVQTAIGRAGGKRIEFAHLPAALRKSATEATAAAIVKAKPALTLDEVLERVEMRMIESALRKAKGDQTAAAEILGVYRSRLFRRIKAFGLDK